MPNKYPEEIKKQVVQFYKDGRPVSEISKELQIPFGTPNGLIFHSDRGGQYISGAFTKLLRNRGYNNPFQLPENRAIMLWQKHSLPPSKRKKPTAEPIHLSRTIVKALNST